MTGPLRTDHAWIDHIPALWIEPAQTARRLALWLPWFTGDKETTRPYLTQLARSGFVAVSFDPWEHGERARETTAALEARVFGHYRRHMWPILAHTTEDVLRVIDWAVQRFGASDVCAGGISMGGNVAVAAAGLDQRIRRVAALCATPDWQLAGLDLAPSE